MQVELLGGSCTLAGKLKSGPVMAAGMDSSEWMWRLSQWLMDEMWCLIENNAQVTATAT